MFFLSSFFEVTSLRTPWVLRLQGRRVVTLFEKREVSSLLLIENGEPNGPYNLQTAGEGMAQSWQGSDHSDNMR